MSPQNYSLCLCSFQRRRHVCMYINHAYTYEQRWFIQTTHIHTYTWIHTRVRFTAITVAILILTQWQYSYSHSEYCHCDHNIKSGCRACNTNMYRHMHRPTHEPLCSCTGIEKYKHAAAVLDKLSWECNMVYAHMLLMFHGSVTMVYAHDVYRATRACTTASRMATVILGTT